MKSWEKRTFFADYRLLEPHLYLYGITMFNQDLFDCFLFQGSGFGCAPVYFEPELQHEILYR